MYAARVDGGRVVQVIVGNAVWASERLGGMWLASADEVGVGWQVVDGQIVPPPAPEVDPDAVLDEGVL